MVKDQSIVQVLLKAFHHNVFMLQVHINPINQELWMEILN